MLVLGVLDKTRAEERYDRHRDDVRAEECDDHSKRECREEVLADTRKQHDGKEDNGCAEGSRQHGELDLFAALLGCFDRVRAHLEMAKDVLKHHDRVVDKA